MKHPLTLTLLSLHIGLAYAQTPVSQTADTPEFEETMELSPIVITATRGAKQKLEIPESVEVISAAQIEKHNINDAQDLIRHVPGVTVSRKSSGADPFANLSGFNIRGVGGNRLQVQVDGSRIRAIVISGV